MLNLFRKMLYNNRELVELKYFSEISKDLDLLNLSEITDKSISSNRSKGLTGILFFDYGYFGQIIEGERAIVDELWGKIQKDRRHQNIKLLSISSIKERRFPDWGMKLFNAKEFSEAFPQFTDILDELNDVDVEIYQTIKMLWSKI